MTKSQAIIHDYKTLAMPLEKLAEKYNTSIHDIIQLMYNKMVKGA